MITALCLRRFEVKANGKATLVELAHTAEFIVLPERGDVVEFPEGGTAVVARAFRAQVAAWMPGVMPSGVMLRCATEPPERLPLVEKYAQRVEPPGVT
jgi:hypothetical protein